MTAVGVQLKRHLPLWLQRPLKQTYYALYRLWVRFWCGLCRLADRLSDDPSPAQLAPPFLRFKVGGTPSRRVFLETGRNSVANLQAVLRSVGKPLEEAPGGRVLDFGCGCGRSAIWLAKACPRLEIYGCDTDEQAIQWCRGHLDGERFAVGCRLPPLPFGEIRFDWIYAISVFSHLGEEDLRQWLEHLHTRLVPTGALVLTVHGEAVWRHLPQDQQAAVRRQGHLTLHSTKLQGIFPAWYQTTLHTESHLRSLCSRHFARVEYFPEGMGFQDAVVCLKSANLP